MELRTVIVRPASEPPPPPRSGPPPSPTHAAAATHDQAREAEGPEGQAPGRRHVPLRSRSSRDPARGRRTQPTTVHQGHGPEDRRPLARRAGHRHLRRVPENVPSFENQAGTDKRAGLHSHGDGLMHIHPFTEDEAGDAATVGRFFDYGGWQVDRGRTRAVGRHQRDERRSVPRRPAGNGPVGGERRGAVREPGGLPARRPGRDHDRVPARRRADPRPPPRADRAPQPGRRRAAGAGRQDCGEDRLAAPAPAGVPCRRLPDVASGLSRAPLPAGQLLGRGSADRVGVRRRGRDPSRTVADGPEPPSEALGIASRSSGFMSTSAAHAAMSAAELGELVGPGRDPLDVGEELVGTGDGLGAGPTASTASSPARLFSTSRRWANCESTPAARPARCAAPARSTARSASPPRPGGSARPPAARRTARTGRAGARAPST